MSYLYSQQLSTPSEHLDSLQVILSTSTRLWSYMDPTNQASSLMYLGPTAKRSGPKRMSVELVIMPEVLLLEVLSSHPPSLLRTLPLCTQMFFLETWLCQVCHYLFLSGILPRHPNFRSAKAHLASRGFPLPYNLHQNLTALSVMPPSQPKTTTPHTETPLSLL